MNQCVKKISFEPCEFQKDVDVNLSYEILGIKIKDIFAIIVVLVLFKCFTSFNNVCWNCC